MKISIVIPCFNEESTIDKVLERAWVAPVPVEREIIVVDDGSTDGTRERLKDWERRRPDSVRVIYQDRNRGKGAALRRGFKEARGEVILIQDADLEYDPSDYLRLLTPFLDGRAEVVYGSRFVGGEAHRVLYFWHYVINKCLTLLCNMVTNLDLTDIEVGYKAFRREVLEKLQLKENGFGFEPEVTIKMSRLKCRVYEVGISYSGRTYQEGKKIGWRDGFRALFVILKCGLLRL